MNLQIRHYTLQLQLLQQLERLEQLQQLERLEPLQQLEQLERLEITNDTYLNYKYIDGDIVYCDPPYENTTKYDKDGFDHKQFYDWVASRAYPVYFSSYKISDNRFNVVFEKHKQVKLQAKDNGGAALEKIYSNRAINKDKPLLTPL